MSDRAQEIIKKYNLNVPKQSTTSNNLSPDTSSRAQSLIQQYGLQTEQPSTTQNPAVPTPVSMPTYGDYTPDAYAARKAEQEAAKSDFTGNLLSYLGTSLGMAQKSAAGIMVKPETVRDVQSKWQATQDAKRRYDEQLQALAPDLAVGWSRAQMEGQELQDLYQQILKLEFAGLDEETKRSEDYIRDYNGKVGRYNEILAGYEAKPDEYTVDNVGDWINRAYYLSTMPAKKWTAAEAQEAREILAVLEDPSVFKSGDYFDRMVTEGDANEFLAMQEVMNNLRNRLHPGALAIETGLFRGTGATSIAKAAANAIGEQRLADQIANIEENEAFASSKAKFAYNAAELTGGLAALSGISSVTHGLVGMTKLPALAKMLVSGASTFATNTAIQELGSMTGGEIRIGKYALDVGVSGIAGAAGAGTAKILTSTGAKLLTKLGLTNNNLANTILAGLSGASFAGGDAAIRTIAGYLEYGKNYKPNPGDIAKNVMLSMAFGAFDYAIKAQWGASKTPGSDTPQKPTEEFFKDGMTPEEMKKAYRAYVKQYHPDLHPGDTTAADIMAKINAEYEAWQAWNVSNAASAGERARADKAEAESRGDTEATAQAEAEMQEAIRALTEYVDGADSGPLSSTEAQEAAQILSALAGDTATPDVPMVPEAPEAVTAEQPTALQEAPPQEEAPEQLQFAQETTQNLAPAEETKPVLAEEKPAMPTEPEAEEHIVPVEEATADELPDEAITTRKKGVVSAENVKLSDLRRTFNDSQNTAYRVLTVYAETTGVNIVLYDSKADSAGNYPSEQGRFQWKDDTIYIDINSGLFSTKDIKDLGRYTMLRTFGHEFSHFVGKWNEARYNAFKEFVFSTMKARGANVEQMIKDIQASDKSGKMTPKQASREVLAEALSDILPDSKLVTKIANQQPTTFRKIHKKLKVYRGRLKQAYHRMEGSPREALVLKENGKYLDEIVKMWDDIAKEAVENYQAAKGTPAAETKKAESKKAEQAQVVTDINVGNTGEAPQKAAETQAVSAEPEIPVAPKTPAQEQKAVSEAAKADMPQEESPNFAKEETQNARHDGAVEEGKASNVDQGVGERSEGVREGSPGRESPPDVAEREQPAGNLQEHGEGGQDRVREPASKDRAGKTDRNGRDRGNGDSGRLQSRGDAGRTVRKHGKADSGIQETVPLKPRDKQNARNYRIETDIDNIKPNFQDNYNAIKLVKKLIAENRPATDEERAVLAKYKGWGGLKNYILNPNGYYAQQLKKLMTPEEYEAARDSVLNAHYTSTKVISGIYKAVQRMGFKGGNILEPSMGVGNFFGMLPKNLSSKSSLYGVELDKITGTIAKNLYPDARIDVTGFQDILYGDGTFDLVVGNVPFSNDIKIPYRGNKYNLHDFFFVKALDETRPGGVLALITSTGTLDKLNGKTQTAIADRANLIAAFRLPDNAFLTNAGTSVTTDLIFLQRKGPGIADNGVRFTEIGQINGTPINEYFVDHPENILGELAYEKGMYASERTVVHATSDFEQRFNKAMDSLPKNLMNGQASGDVSVKKRGQKAKTTFAVTDKGAVLVDSEGKTTELSTKQADIVKKYTGIKDLYFRTSEAERNGNIAAAEEYRGRLNKSYDAFTSKYGTLESNKRLLGKDDEFLRVSGLEIVDKEGNVSKSAIFEKPTLFREKKTSAASSSEGLSIVLNETGRVDIDAIAKLTGKTAEEVAEDLADEIILTPDGDYVLIPQYLSGNIYQKLDAIKGRKGFERQEELLKTVLPKPKTAQTIDAEISSHWIPPKYVGQFITEQFNPYGGVEVKYVKELGKWDMPRFYSPIRKWSTKRVDAFDLLLNTLNNKRIAVYDTNSDGSRVFNAEETKVAQNKQNELRSAFREWVFKDEARRADLESVFNRTLNAYAPLDYNSLADKLDLGIDPNSPIQPRDYQKAAVARIVFGGNTLLHHGVGTGKTATMIMAAHVLKNTGIANKPMFVVPNGKTIDFKREILKLYPRANVLALDADLLSPKEIQRTKALIATNDWDYVLIHKTGFQKIGVSPETTAAFIEQQLDELETAIRESGADEKRGTRFEKSLIAKKKNLEEKLKKILESPKDDSSTFETMGIDALFVDEAHNFKKVGFATTQSISGVDSSTNALTTDLYMKENWIRDRGGRIVLATATPITNTVSEMYNMTLHVNPDILREAGVYAFDGWLNTFGDLRSEMEIASDGKTFRMKERIQDFKNGNELISLYRQFADVKQTKDVVKGLPKAEEVTVVVKGSPFHQKLLDSFAKRMDSVGRGSKDDNALNVNNDARAAATDLRMVSGILEQMFPGTTVEDLDLPDSKINKAVGYIVDEYRKSMKNKGTQLVFLDSGMGRGKATRYKFNLYGDLINKLVENGIPREEIADIGDYNGDEARQKLYDLVNAGTIRVLIGSTAKMGEGVNVQNKIVALHDLSVPMRADNLDQRHGRAIRFGNENDSVRIYKYIQEQSYDSYLWQMVERKSKYMAQAYNGGDASDLEEISNVTVNARESKALATGNPAIMEKFKLDDEVNTLRTLERAFIAETQEAGRTAARYKAQIAQYKDKIAALKDIDKTLAKNRKDDFELTVGNETFTDRGDAASALYEAYTKPGTKSIGNIYGLKISKATDPESGYKGIVFNGNIDTFIPFGESESGNVTRLLNGLDKIKPTIQKYERWADSAKKTVADAEKTAARTEFPKKAELNEKLSRLEEINRELGIKSDTVEINVTSAENDDIEEMSTRRQSLSNTEVLELAADQIDASKLSDAEKAALGIFQKRLDALREAQDQREELGRQYKDQQFTKGGSRSEAEKIRNRMQVMDGRIQRLENELVSLENKDVLRNVLNEARKVVEANEKKHGDTILKQYRDKRNESDAKRKYRTRIKKEAETLRKWLVNPSNKDILKHVPAEIQKSVADFLDSINLMSKTALRTGGLETTKEDKTYLKNMKKLHDAIKENVDAVGLYSGYSDLPPDFLDKFYSLIRNAEQHMEDHPGVFVVNEMSAAELHDLSEAIRTLKKYITKMNTLHNNAIFQHASDLGEDTVQHLEPMAMSNKSGFVYHRLRFDYMRPSYAFEHFGKGGQSIEHEFRDGHDIQAKLAKIVIDFAKATYTGKEVKEWSEDVKTFTLSDGKEIRLSVADIMSLYRTVKRDQGKLHVYGDGIRIHNFKVNGKLYKDIGHVMSQEDVQNITASLTPRQIEVADALQGFMRDVCSEWGNYVSIARFDVKQWDDPNYFPLNSDGRYLAATADENPDNAGLYALLNLGITKSLNENAKNRIVIYNIFDVFANYTSSVIQYRAFALPVLDALKWINYKTDGAGAFLQNRMEALGISKEELAEITGIDKATIKKYAKDSTFSVPASDAVLLANALDCGINDINCGTSVREQLSKAFGAPEEARPGSGIKGYAENFVLNLIRAYNGTAANGDPYDSFELQALHRFNRAQIAFSSRVFIQQPVSIARAAMILSPNKLLQGLGMSALQMKALAEEMETHAGIALWKQFGFFDVNISRGLTEIIKQNPDVQEKVMSAGTWIPQQLDRYTWAAIWYAAKQSVNRSSYATEAEYFNAVKDVFEDVIYKTQVVDSVLTKSEFSRAKGLGARMLGSFMSEPLTTLSMLTDAYYKYTDDRQRGNSKSEAWKKNKKNIGKAFVVYAFGQILLSVVQSFADAWRDNDEYDTENWFSNYFQKWVQAFKKNLVDNILPFGLIPGISELYEVTKGVLDYAGLFDKWGLDLYGNGISNGWAQYADYLVKAAKIIIDKTTGAHSTNYTWWGAIHNLLRGGSGASGWPIANIAREVIDMWNNTVGYFVPRMRVNTYESSLYKAYIEFVRPTGVSQKQLEAILSEASDDGSFYPSQDELGERLYAALYNGEVNKEQADAIWSVRGWSAEHNLDWWLFRTENSKYFDAADVEGNGVSQNELGPVLQEAVESGEITAEKASEIWATQKWKTTYEEWAAKQNK